MSSKPSNLLKATTVKQLHSERKSIGTNSLYSGVQSAERDIQQQRYFGSASTWHSAQSKHGGERGSVAVTGNRTLPFNYYCGWESEYNKIITREKLIKPMTKDPYTPMSRLICHAVERVTTEAECSLPLIPADAVQIKTVDIREAPRPSMSIPVRYLRRHELMPSERSVRPSAPVKVLLSESEFNKPTISTVNVNKITGVAPTLATTDRLLNRAKMRNDPSVIRRPPRKLTMDISHETIMPFSIYV